MKHAAICFRTEEPDFSALPEQQFDWAYTIYSHMEEVLPHDMPTPLGKFVTLKKNLAIKVLSLYI